MNVEQKDNLEHLKSKVRKLEKILKESKYKNILHYMEKSYITLYGVRVVTYFRENFIFLIINGDFNEKFISLEEVNDILLFNILLYSVQNFLSSLLNNVKFGVCNNPTCKDIAKSLDSLCVEFSNLETFK